LILPAPLAWRYPQVFYRSDPDVLFTLVPDERAYSADKPVHINARGMRGEMVPYERTPGRKRIVFIGDSIAFGYGVLDEEVVTSRVAGLLGAQGVATEVINASVPAYNTVQEVTLLERDGLRYRPDWVIVGVCWNDLSDKSHVRVSPEGWLVENTSQDANEPGFSEGPRGYAVRNFVKRSRLLYAANQVWRDVSGQFDDVKLYRDEVLQGRETETTREGWWRVGTAIHRLRYLSNEFGFHPLLVTFPMPLALERSFPRSAYPEGFKAIADREGIPLLDLDPAFRASYRGHESLFIPYDGDHPNARGHDIAAREIVKFLLRANGA